MSTTEPQPSRLRGIGAGMIVILVLLAVMWAMEIIDLLPGTPFDSWGVRPRSLEQWWGVLAHPFLHGGFGHLIGNSTALLLLGPLVALGGMRRLLVVTVLSVLGSGVLIWLIGAGTSVHIGASGVVFGFIGYLLSYGLAARRPLWIVAGVLVGLLYGGSIIVGILPTDQFSWEGHLGGLIGGVIAAIALRNYSRDD